MKNTVVRQAATFIICLALAAFMVFAPAAFAKDAETYAFITDTHIGAGKSAETDLSKAFAYAKKQDNLAVVINCGDVTDTGGKSEYQKYLSLWNKSKLDVPRIQVMGNHDDATGGYQKWLHQAGFYGYTKRTGTKLFKSILNDGKSNTVTKFQNANVITIGQGIGSKGGVFPKSSVKWLDKQLKSTIRSGKIAIVVCHYAPWHGTDDKFKRIPANFHKIVGVCQSYPNVIYVCGHEHVFEQYPQYFVGHYKKYTYKKATANPYKRSGIDASKAKYKMNLLCLNSVSRVHGFHVGKADPDRDSFVHTLAFDGNGNVTFDIYDQTKKKHTQTNTFKQNKNSVKIKVDVPKKAAFAGTVKVKVSFSDKATHDGIASGSTIEVVPGKTFTISGIPSGVLVSASCTTGIDGCKKPSKQSVELGLKASKMNFSYK